MEPCAYCGTFGSHENIRGQPECGGCARPIVLAEAEQRYYTDGGTPAHPYFIQGGLALLADRATASMKDLDLAEGPGEGVVVGMPVVTSPQVEMGEVRVVDGNMARRAFDKAMRSWLLGVGRW